MVEKKQDLKQAMGGKKPMLSLIPKAPLVYSARAHQWGDFKYRETGNYLRSGGDPLDHYLEYSRALQGHLKDVDEAVIRFKASAKNASPTAAGAINHLDKESHLPSLAHVGASYNIMIAKLVDAGLLVEDPGRPWLEFYESTVEPGVLIPVKK